MGGEMGKMADRCYLQKRILNRSKVRFLCLEYLFAMYQGLAIKTEAES